MKSEYQSVLPSLLTLAVVTWLMYGVAYLRGLRPLGPQRRRATPWGAAEVGVLLLTFVPQFMIAQYSLNRPVIEAQRSDDFDDDQRPAAVDRNLTNPIPIGLIWAAQLGFLVQVVLPIFLLTVRGARPYQMGMHCHKWQRFTAIGVGSFVLSFPIVGIALVAATSQFGERAHAVERLLKSDPTVWNMILWGFFVVIVAPGIEELLFRGILLPGLIRCSGPWRAIVASSFVFALLHFDAWPAPIPLFVFALFLSYLMYRTNSLVPSFVLHATFNAVNFAMLVTAIKMGIG